VWIARDMKRRLLNLLTLLSLLLCVAVAALWVRSERTQDVVGYRFGSGPGGWRTVQLTSQHGHFLVEFIKPERYDGGGWAAPWARPEAEGVRRRWSRRSVALAPRSALDPFWLLRLNARWQGLGLMWCRETMEPGYSGRVISISTLVVPAPAVLAVSAVPAAAWVAARLVRYARGHWRRRSGRCRRCGYDLRATPGRCPECGTIAAAPPAT
jgi:hypothetical protein